MKINLQNRKAIATVIAFVLSAIFIRGCYMAVRHDSPVHSPELIIVGSDSAAVAANSGNDSVKVKKSSKKTREKRRPKERNFLDEPVPSSGNGIR